MNFVKLKQAQPVNVVDLGMRILNTCPALMNPRKQLYSRIKTLVIDYIGIEQRSENYGNKDKIVQLLLDCSFFNGISKSIYYNGCA